MSEAKAAGLGSATSSCLLAAPALSFPESLPNSLVLRVQGSSPDSLTKARFLPVTVLRSLANKTRWSIVLDLMSSLADPSLQKKTR